MKLHIGCGEKYLPGWKHLDARKFPHVDYITDKLDKLDMFADNSVLRKRSRDDSGGEETGAALQKISRRKF